MQAHTDITELIEDLMELSQQAVNTMLDTAPSKATVTTIYMPRTVQSRYAKKP